MPFQVIETQRLYQRVAEQLAALIRGGELKAGERLPPERDLCGRLGVSRPVLREAMIALEIGGLVEVRPGAGAYITCPHPPAKLPDAGPGPFDLLAARRMLEGEVVALAAETATPEDLAELRGHLTAQREAVAAGHEGIEWDRAFHLAVARMTGNDYLLRMVAMLWDQAGTPIFSRLAARTHDPAKFAATLADHEHILDCIARGQSAEARTALHDHLRHVEQFFLGDAGAPKGAPAAAPTVPTGKAP